MRTFMPGNHLTFANDLPLPAGLTGAQLIHHIHKETQS